MAPCINAGHFPKCLILGIFLEDVCMNENNRVAPRGSELVDLLVDDERALLLKEIALNLPDIT